MAARDQEEESRAAAVKVMWRTAFSEVTVVFLSSVFDADILTVLACRGLPTCPRFFLAWFGVLR